VKAVGVNATARAHQVVQPLGHANEQRAHALGHGTAVVGLDDEMHVVALHREVHDPEALALLAELGEGTGDGPETPLRTEVPHPAARADGDVVRMARVDRRATPVRLPGPGLRRPTAPRTLLELLAREE